MVGLALFLGISGGSWALTHSLSVSIQNRDPGGAGGADRARLRDPAEIEETPWGATLCEIDGERFVVLPDKTLDHPRRTPPGRCARRGAAQTPEPGGGRHRPAQGERNPGATGFRVSSLDTPVGFIGDGSRTPVEAVPNRSPDAVGARNSACGGTWVRFRKGACRIALETRRTALRLLGAPARRTASRLRTAVTLRRISGSKWWVKCDTLPTINVSCRARATSAATRRP